MIAITLANGEKFKAYSPVVTNLMVSENEIGTDGNGEYYIGTNFSGVIPDGCSITNGKLDDKYKILILNKNKRSSDEKFTCTGLIVENVIHKKNSFVSKFLRIYKELRVPQYHPCRSPKIIHDLIKSVLPSAIINGVVRQDYGMHWYPGYSIKFNQYGFGGIYMNFAYSGELIDLSVYPTCGNEIDITEMDSNALQAYYAESEEKYYKDLYGDAE